MTSSSVPLKQCSSKEYCIHPDCESGWLPLARKYFNYEEKRSRWHTRCNACKKSQDYARHQQPENQEKARQQKKSPERKAWRKIYDSIPENKAKKDAYGKEWWSRPGKMEAARERTRQRHTRLKDDPREQQYMLDYHKEYNVRPEVKERQRLRHQTPEYKEQQRERRKTPEFRAYMKVHLNRRLARKRALPDNFTVEQWNAALIYFGHACAVCGRSFIDKDDSYAAAADHWIPLSSPLCPGTIATNIVPLCHGVGGCNNSKRNHIAEEWLFRIYDETRARIILARVERYFDSLS